MGDIEKNQRKEEVVATSTSGGGDWELVEASSSFSSCEERTDCSEQSNDENDGNAQQATDTVDVDEETTTTTSDDDDDDSDGETVKNAPSMSDLVRKTGVAVAGGAMVGVGLVMIPLPTPFGAVIAGGGMAVLGTEFPAAKRVLDETCNKVADAIEHSVKKDDEKELERMNQNDADSDAESQQQQETTTLAGRETPNMSRTDSDESDDKDYQQIQLSGSDLSMNEKMKDLLLEQRKLPRQQDGQQQQQVDFSLKREVKELGRKAVPVIRKIGEGVDKEQLDRAAKNVTKAGATVTNQVSKLWRHIMVLDENEHILSPFVERTNSRKSSRASSPEKVRVQESEHDQQDSAGDRQPAEKLREASC